LLCQKKEKKGGEIGESQQAKNVVKEVREREKVKEGESERGRK